MPNDVGAAEQRPTPGTPRSYHFPEVQRHQTTSGIDVIVATVTRVPVVTLHYVIDGGAIYEPAGSAGTAQLTAKGIAEGTQALSGDDIAQRFELLGTSVEPDAGWEELELRSTVMSSRLTQAAALAAEVLTSPAFRADDLARLQHERIAELMQRDTEPRGLADDAFSRVLYGPDSRLGFPIGGERETVREFGASRAREWHERAFRPERMAVIVAGDVEADEAFAVMERIWGSWRATASPLLMPSGGHRPRRSATHFVAKTDAVQSEIRIGHTGPPRVNADYFELTVLNAILGGLFGSRINLNLREAHGYTYGAFSGFDWRRDGSNFCVSTAVRSDATVQAVREIRSEISRIRDEPVSTSELSLAVEHLEGVFPIRFETTAAMTNALASQLIFGLPRTYFDDYREKIRSVSAADVQRVAQAHLRPGDLNLVVVGNAALKEELTVLTDGDLVMEGLAADTEL
ncbi:MAG: pitrilysin family protein [Gemmatimonadaceae bacterium]